MVARQLDDAIISTVDKKTSGDNYAPVCQVWGSTHNCVEEETSTHKHAYCVAYCLCFRDMYVYEICHFFNFFGGNPSRYVKKKQQLDQIRKVKSKVGHLY